MAIRMRLYAIAVVGGFVIATCIARFAAVVGQIADVD
jgi:hypothetical protein